MPTKIINGKKNCSKCKQIKELTEFRKHIFHSTGYRSQCKKCEIASHKIRIYDGVRTKYIKRKDEVIKHYGGKCECCGIDNIYFLSIDHINKDASKQKGNRKRRATGEELYRYLIKNNYPNNVRVLCFNCHFGMHFNSEICPHKR